jgi:hypothetical protein
MDSINYHYFWMSTHYMSYLSTIVAGREYPLVDMSIKYKCQHENLSPRNNFYHERCNFLEEVWFWFDMLLDQKWFLKSLCYYIRDSIFHVFHNACIRDSPKRGKLADNSVDRGLEFFHCDNLVKRGKKFFLVPGKNWKIYSLGTRPWKLLKNVGATTQ